MERCIPRWQRAASSRFPRVSPREILLVLLVFIFKNETLFSNLLDARFKFSEDTPENLKFVSGMFAEELCVQFLANGA